MPRLHGYRERIDTTVYDAFSPREFVESKDREPYIRLFGNKNIGQSALTNMQIGGQMAADTTLTIITWYARTNLTDVCRFQIGAPYRGDWAPPSVDLIRAWDAWANVTTADLVGARPVLTRPLSQLLGPRQFGNACGNPGGVSQGDDIEQLAEKMWIRYRDGQIAGKPTRGRHAHSEATFGDLPEATREVWLSAAAVYPFIRPVIVPVRQNFGVRIQTDRQALTELLKVMPENVAPRPLVWVHLDGHHTRDVA
jgi:hypothetical protein